MIHGEQATILFIKNKRQACLLSFHWRRKPSTGGLIVIDPENGKSFLVTLGDHQNTNLRMPYLQFHCQEIKFFYLNAMKKEVSSRI